MGQGFIPGNAKNANGESKVVLEGVSLQAYGDIPSIDAFDRLRTSEPFTIFDSKQLHDKQPLFWDESVGGSATSAHSPANAATQIAGKVYKIIGF